jgi:hypothetical protein
VAMGSTGRRGAAARWALAVVVSATLCLAVRLVGTRASLEGLPGVGVVSLWGRQTLTMLLWIGGGIVVAVLARVASLVSRDRTSPAQVRFEWAQVIAAFGAAVFGAFVGGELASGAWISRQWFSWLVIAGPVVVSPVVAVAFIRKMFVAEGVRSAGRGASAGWVAVGLGLHLVDVSVLLRLHPAAHAVLWLTGSALVLVAVTRRLETREVPAPGWMAMAAGLAAMIGLGQWTLMSPDLRTEFALRGLADPDFLAATTFRHGPTHVQREIERLAAEVAHAPVVPPRSELALAAAPALADPETSVLLVVVDAMRADVASPERLDGRSHYMRAGDTPFLTEWMAANAVTFARAYTPGSATHLALPSLFYSVDAFEGVTADSVHVAEHMKRSGRSTFAVVPRWFVREQGSFDDSERAEMDEWQRPHHGAHSVAYRGVDHTLTYDDREPGEPERVVARALAQMSSTPGPSFGWLHVMAMHTPCYDGQVLRGQPHEASYRRSARWVDERMRALIEGLAADPRLASTIVIITGDHGEGLGDNEMKTHGITVFEEETRVPLWVYVPGAEPRRVDEIVSLIDVAPTIVAAVGGPSVPAYSGRSLVPLLQASVPAWPGRDLFLTSGLREQIAVVSDSGKIIYQRAVDGFSRFDVRRDPGENRSLHAGVSDEERRLLHRYMIGSPEQVVRGLAEADRTTIARYLDVYEHSDVHEGFEAMLSLARAAGPETRAAVKRLHDRATSDAIRDRTSAALTGP